MVVLVPLVVTACARAAGGPPSSEPFWPATDRPIALVAKGNELFVTDGLAVQPIEMPAVTDPVGPPPVVSEGQWLAGISADRIYVLDLATGESKWRTCRRCSGLSLRSGRVTTIGRDGRLVTLDTSLHIVRVAHLAGLVGQDPPPSAASEDPSWAPEYTVAGHMGEHVVVASLPRWASLRGGPTLLSLVDDQGRVTAEREVPARFHSSSAKPDGTALLIASWASAGACSSGNVLSSIDADLLTQQLTADGSDGREGDAQVITDWSWNGNQVLWVGFELGWGVADEGRCRRAAWHVNQQTDEGSTPQTLPSPALWSLRVLNGCEEMVALQEQPGSGRHLLAVHHSERHDLGRFDSIVWSAPAHSSCDDIQAALGVIDGAS